MKQLQHFSLDKKTPIKSFSCSHSFSGMKIKRIIIPSLSAYPESQWAGLLDGTYLKIDSSSANGGVPTKTKHLNFAVSPYHRHPSFDFDDFFPEANENNMQSISPFFNQVEYSLILPKKAPDIKIDVYYEEYPIVKAL